MGYFNLFTLEGIKVHLDGIANISGMSLAFPTCRPSPCTLCKGLVSI